MKKPVAWFFLLVVLGSMFSLKVYAEQKIKLKDLSKEYTRVGIEVYKLGQKTDEVMSEDYPEGEFVSDLYKTAIAIFESAIKLNPQDTKAHYYLGKSYHNASFIDLGEYDKEYLRKAEKEYLFVIQTAEKNKEYKNMVSDSKEELKNVKSWLKD